MITPHKINITFYEPELKIIFFLYYLSKACNASMGKNHPHYYLYCTVFILKTKGIIYIYVWVSWKKKKKRSLIKLMHPHKW